MAISTCNADVKGSIPFGSIPYFGDSREMFHGGNVMSRTAILLESAEKSLTRIGNRGGTFTADDVQAFLDLKRFRGNRLSFVNSLLNSSLFYSTGDFVPSERPVARGRRIQVWTTYED